MTGPQFKGAMRAYRELKREDAKLRQSEFDKAYEEYLLKHSTEPRGRKAFGQIRHLRRVMSIEAQS